MLAMLLSLKEIIQIAAYKIEIIERINHLYHYLCVFYRLEYTKFREKSKIFEHFWEQVYESTNKHIFH